MRLRNFACSLLAFSLLGGIAIAHPQPADFDRVTEVREFARPPEVKLDRASIKAALATRRAQNLALFRAYRSGGVYPHNFVKDGALNVWLDQEGRLCAAATMIAKSGHTDLAMTVAGSNDFIRLADVKDGALMDWILTSGFTQAEIVSIQEPFMGPQDPFVDPRQADPVRTTEDQRLSKRYAQVDRQLVRARAKSLDVAVDRLMAHPDLAAGLLAELAAS